MHTLIRIVRDFKPKELFALLLLIALFVCSTLLLAMRIQYINDVALTNQGYVRYTACVIDVRNEMGVVTISDKISDACWDQAERESGTKLERYSEKIILE